MKFINLILYSRNQEYDIMKNILKKYYKIYDNVITYFYIFDENLESDFKLDDDILYIKGKETYIPGILTKTIKAFNYIYENFNDFNYIIRSNISTIIDIKELEYELNNNPVEYYGGGNILSLQWIDPKSGIHDHRWFKTLFAQGTAIILSKKGLDFIIKNVNKINYDVVDDVSLGLFFKDNKPEYIPQRVGINKFNELTNLADINLLSKFMEIYKIIFFRHKCAENRNVDIFHMNHITKILMNKNI